MRGLWQVVCPLQKGAKMRAICDGKREKVQGLTENVMKISRKGAKKEKQGRTLRLLCAFAPLREN